MRRCTLILLLCALLGGCAREQVQDRRENLSFFAMDTSVSLTACGENARDALEAAQELMLQLESLWSVTDSGSEIWAANHANGDAVELSEETANLVEFAQEMASRTDGALEPTIYPVLTAWGFTTDENRVPDAQELAQLLELVDYRRVRLDGRRLLLPEGMQLDPGAVGKGYAGDLLLELLREYGVKSALLDVGGSIHALGSRPDGDPWRIALRNPLGEGSLGILSVSDAAVVTSGSYERYFVDETGARRGHILDPATGMPADSGLASATIVADAGGLADALSTALYVMGLDRAAEHWRQYGDFEMLLVENDGSMWITPGLRAQFEPSTGVVVHEIEA